jgi:hypothetical protein
MMGGVGVQARSDDRINKKCQREIKSVTDLAIILLWGTCSGGVAGVPACGCSQWGREVPAKA